MKFIQHTVSHYDDSNRDVKYKVNKKQLKRKKKYMFQRSRELAFEIYCLSNSIRITYLYDHGAFSIKELVDLMKFLKMTNIVTVSFVNNDINNIENEDSQELYDTTGESVF